MRYNFIILIIALLAVINVFAMHNGSSDIKNLSDQLSLRTKRSYLMSSGGSSGSSSAVSPQIKTRLKRQSLSGITEGRNGLFDHSDNINNTQNTQSGLQGKK